jgi:hypothetical protein
MTATRTVLVGAVVWLVVALFLGGSGALLGIPAPTLVALVASLAFVLLVASWAVPPLRRFARSADLRLLAGFHLLRFVGLYFVVLGLRGLLPALFVLAAGWGNLLVAVLALLLLAWVPPASPRGRPWWVGWNLLGLSVALSVGIVVLVIGRSAPEPMLRVLPFSLLPSFVAPIAVATHVWMLVRLLNADSPSL